MVEGEQMGVAELHNTLGVGAHLSNIVTELVPGQDNADLHHTIQRASRPPAVLAVRRANVKRERERNVTHLFAGSRRLLSGSSPFGDAT
ncbi:hypothetical protein EB73_30190 [Mycobacterium sp. SWH-M3]|nr:hypothetical protein EB73_30190 [Mycobacterium sp. SWH-M3]